ncbi:hypothetical protein [Chengkuizengella axinellae]|uniref:Helix-turn-helix domain-containing protein n=1 Tax=Chengkuizengella axinellae TaxID=3064388 RepID=A0ABT9J514_9BACL|nr:hypothetical protein [Chengkuizengella sp. 2205SS18-9]MDP5276568.1 hypothetical protein [Chengkuizengella sp. 2205SS18-9]
MDGQLFHIVMDAESSRTHFQKMKKKLILERKLAKELNDINMLDDADLDIISLNRAISNLNAQIELINLTHRNELIPDKFFQATKLSELQNKVIHKRLIEKKTFHQIESELAYINHNLNARDSFKKGYSKIKKAASSYKEAVNLGLSEVEAIQYIQMSNKTREIWLMYKNGQSYSKISKILNVSKPYISKVLKPYKND